MLRHYKISREGPLGALKDFYFGKLPIHLTEEHYNKWLYILYVYTKFFTSSIPSDFSKLIIESIDILSKNDMEVADEYDKAHRDIAEVKKTWLYKNILTKSNKTWVDIQKKILAMYKTLGIEFKGIHPTYGGVWFPYIHRNLNNTDNTRGENSGILIQENRGWYSPLYMPIVYGTDDCTNCVFTGWLGDSGIPVHIPAYPFPMLRNNPVVLCDNKGRHDDRISINPDKFTPEHMFSFIKSNLNNLGKFQRAYEEIKRNDDVGTLEGSNFFYARESILLSSDDPKNKPTLGFASKKTKPPFYLDMYSSCLAGFVDDPLNKSSLVNWKDNIEKTLKYIEYKYIK